jgi:hypothetical protein
VGLGLVEVEEVVGVEGLAATCASKGGDAVEGGVPLSVGEVRV